MTNTSSAIHPVVLIGGGPGAWDLITVRGMRALQAADVILADQLGPTSELDKLCDVAAKEVVDVSKLPYGKQVAQSKINELLVEYALTGKRVVRLKGGDPYVFGRGYEELEHLASHGIACEVIPGVTSGIAVPALAGVPITLRGVVHNFSIISGHLPPRHPKSLNDFDALAKTGGTLAVIMGVKNAGAIATALIEGGLPESTPVAVIQEGTMEGERSFRCDLASLGESMISWDVRPPAVIVIGDVAGV